MTPEICRECGKWIYDKRSIAVWDDQKRAICYDCVNNVILTYEEASRRKKQKAKEARERRVKRGFPAYPMI